MKNRITISLVLAIAVGALVFNYARAINISPQEMKALFGKETMLGATILFPSGGGTGTSTNPTYGKILVGTSGGVYQLQATSTLGITVSETDPVWTAVSGNYLLTANAFTQAIASTTFQPIITAGTYDPYGQATSSLLSFTTPYYATTTHPLISSLPSLSITKSQVSDLGTLFTQAIASTTFVARNDWTTIDNYPTGCTNQFIRTIGDTLTCATVGATDVSLAALTATDTTLTFSGSYTGATARTIGLNLGNANTWTGLQQFGNASTTKLTIDELYDSNGSQGGNGEVLSSTVTGTDWIAAGAGTVSNIATTYPITGGPITTTGTLALAFGTTTANTWSQAQTHTAAPIFSSLTGVLKGNGASALTVAANGTDFTLVSAVSCTNQVMTALNASGAGTCSSVSDAMLSSTFLKTIGSGTNGQLSYWTGTNTLTGIATTTLTASSPLSLSQAVVVIGGATSALSLSTAGTWSGLAGTATALAANPDDCAANTWATAIATSGNLTCGAVTYAGITAMTSANFAGLISDETGTAGKVVFDTAPTLAGLTATGVIDMGGATSFELPNGAAVYTNVAGQMAIDTTAPGQLRWNNGTATSTLMGFSTTGFTYATSTTFTATTTIPLAPAVANLTFVDARCFSDVGTLNISLNDGTNRANMFNASTTVGVITFNTNNTFTENEKIYIDVGTPATAPTKISCRFKYTFDPI